MDHQKLCCCSGEGRREKTEAPKRKKQYLNTLYIPHDSSDDSSSPSCPHSEPVSPGVEHIDVRGETRFVISGCVILNENVGDLDDGRLMISFRGI